MTCPKCHSPMSPVTHDNISVDRCSKCRGLWFDAREHEHLRASKNSESLDVATTTPSSLSPTTPINCPHCHTPMILMTARHQPHIKFESCTVCHGSFFDAGEFRDLKDLTVKEWLRSLLPKR